MVMIFGWSLLGVERFPVDLSTTCVQNLSKNLPQNQDYISTRKMFFSVEEKEFLIGPGGILHFGYKPLW